MARQNVCVLGATGSIGQSTLNVIERNADRYKVTALSAHRDVRGLSELCVRHGAELAVIADPGLKDELASQLRNAGSKAEILAGTQGLVEAARAEETDTVMASIVGAAGLESSLAAAHAGKKVLLANKESLVIAGEVFTSEARSHGASVIPVDSEHNAIFQVLPRRFDQGLEDSGVEKIILTASGGPFLDRSADELAGVTPEQACNHPNWSMGRKISVDSATLMNKGLEVIEARWLFNANPEQIEVLVHPQSIVHSMVSYRDGSVLAQMGTPDMRTPIAHALAWPDRIESGVERLNLAVMSDLSFQSPDMQRFPCLALAFEAMKAGGGAPAVLNAANEVAVESFLNGEMTFPQIPDLVSRVMDRVNIGTVKDIADVMDHDQRGRKEAEQLRKQL